jgi:uncharacterized membrane protein (DUF485 family)
MASPNYGDPTLSVGAPTDIAPAGQLTPKPSHERTAAEESQNANWNQIAAQQEFKDLLRRKARFIIPATIFFVVYYFALPASVGYAKSVMITRVGPVNLAYLFALSQFFMAWVIAALYVRAANRFDRDAASILKSSDKQ